MLYNRTDKVSTFISKVNVPFKARKEMHPSNFQALIDVCSKIGSSIADLSVFTSMCSFFKKSFTIFTSKKFSNHFSPCKQHN